MGIFLLIVFVAIFLVGLVTVARFLWQFCVAWGEWSENYPRQNVDSETYDPFANTELAFEPTTIGADVWQMGRKIL